MPRTPLFRAVVRGLNESIQGEDSIFSAKVSRRSGLLAGGMATVSALLNGCAGSPGVASEEKGKGKQSKVVIVGGGVAGLSAAYALQKAGVHAELYEANDRLGGRIFTHYDFNQEKMFCELGGELIDTGHQEIRDLARSLELELETLPDPSRLSEVFSFDGKWRSHEEIIKAFRPLAQRIARDAEEFIVKGEFSMPTHENPISDRVRVLDHLSLKAYLDSAVECPRWVRELIAVAYVGEYGLEADEQSAINLITFIGTNLADEGFKVFGESDELYRIKGGNSELIRRLDEEISSPIHRSHSLASIARNSKGRFQLLFQGTKEDPAKRVVEVLADSVVLTLPFTVLREIEGIDQIGLNPRKLEAIRELGYGTNTKFMMGFRSRYWRKENSRFPASDGNLICDLKLQGGWDSSRRQKGESGIFTNFLGGDYAKSFTAAHASQAYTDLETLFPGIKDAKDGHSALQVWSAVKTARGSYICPKPGQYTSFGGIASQSECEGRLIFAGEHTSENSAGFMNGAVESGLRAAHEYLKTQTAAQLDAVST